MAHRNNDYDDAVIIKDLMLTAVARIGMYSNRMFEILTEEILPIDGASPRLQAAIKELAHAAREED